MQPIQRSVLSGAVLALVWGACATQSTEPVGATFARFEITFES